MTLTELFLGDFRVEHADCALIELGRQVRLGFAKAPQVYLHLVLSGTAALRVDGSGPAVELRAGEFAVVIYGAAHTLCVSGAKPAIPVHQLAPWISGEEPLQLKLGGPESAVHTLSSLIQISHMPSSAPVNRALPHLLCFSADATRHRAGHVLAGDVTQLASVCRGPGASALAQALVQLYLVQALRAVHDDLEQAFPIQVGDPEMRRMAAVVRKIRACPEKHWTVAALAQEVGCSRSSFAAKFRAYAGLGPIKFVAETRLALALALLKSNHEMPLWEVARRIGYDSQGSFTRAFKARFGIAPRAYVGQFEQVGVAKIPPSGQQE